MTVARTAMCDTLTRKSKLTYQVGTMPDGEVYLRIHRNSGNGFFSREWIALSDIQKAIHRIPAGKPVTAIVLGDLFEGRSVNSPGFLLAALIEEKLLVPMQGRKRSHEPVSRRSSGIGSRKWCPARANLRPHPVRSPRRPGRRPS
jgi:hypothetical protein